MNSSKPISREKTEDVERQLEREQTEHHSSFALTIPQLYLYPLALVYIHAFVLAPRLADTEPPAANLWAVKRTMISIPGDLTSNFWEPGMSLENVSLICCGWMDHPG